VRTVLATALVALALPASALGHGAHAAQAPDPTGNSTADQTVAGGDPRQGFQFLTPGPGEPWVVRTELAPAAAGREAVRRSLAYFGQITDFQLADEESPARVEFFDIDPSGTATSAWRPQEALVAHQVEWTIRQINRFVRSPVRQAGGRRARMMNAVMTGDLADNMQRNETEWVIRLLEGGTLDPNSGTTDLSGTACPPGTPLDDPRNYTGVQDYDDYPAFNQNFYDPDQPAGPYAAWPRYPGLMDRAQQPFEATGLKVPSYIAFGNHDNLVQGNEDANAAFEEVATGCIKPLVAQPGFVNPLEPGNPLVDALPPLSGALDPVYLAGAIADRTRTMLVPPDENRRFVDKLEFKQLSDTGRQEDAHGFAFVDRTELRESNGAASYYAWSPRAGLRFIVLDTVSEGGVTPSSSDGNIDDPQFRWFERELANASADDELVVVFGHHASSSMTADVPDEVAPPCTAADSHGHDVNPGCDRDPRSSQPLHLGGDLEAAMRRFPHAIAYVAGHSHENRVAPVGTAGAGYWEIKSPAVVDWPPQHRVIEVMDNCDDTLSIFATLLDHGGAVTAPPAGTEAPSLDAAGLASIARTFGYNDPQEGPDGSQGQPADRNVELLVRDPRRAAGARAIRLRVTPRRSRTGRMRSFRLRVTTPGGDPVRGAVVRLGGERAVTNSRGRATIRTRLGGRPRIVRARATAPSRCAAPATARIRVRGRQSQRGPSFTG
jgi:metallophosphoesterase (TIGR03767 family)